MPAPLPLPTDAQALKLINELVTHQKSIKAATDLKNAYLAEIEKKHGRSSKFLLARAAKLAMMERDKQVEELARLEADAEKIPHYLGLLTAAKAPAVAMAAKKFAGIAATPASNSSVAIPPHDPDSGEILEPNDAPVEQKHPVPANDDINAQLADLDLDQGDGGILEPIEEEEIPELDIPDVA